jgi:hypothetical protein
MTIVVAFVVLAYRLEGDRSRGRLQHGCRYGHGHASSGRGRSRLRHERLLGARTRLVGGLGALEELAVGR